MPFPVRWLGAAVLAVTLAAPAPATAATVEVDGSVLRYTAAPGERNELTVMLQSGRFTIQEGQNGATPITAVSPCTEAPRDSMGGSIGAYCPPDGVDRIVIDLGDGDDRASVGVMARTDYPTDLSGGEGNDEIHAGGGRPDRVDCGNGADVAYGIPTPPARRHVAGPAAAGTARACPVPRGLPGAGAAVHPRRAAPRADGRRGWRPTRRGLERGAGAAEHRGRPPGGTRITAARHHPGQGRERALARRLPGRPDQSGSSGTDTPGSRCSRTARVIAPAP